MAEHDTHDDSPPRWRAAQYVRMSTEHQQYSTENQRDMIRDYAAKRGIEIVRTYADDGKSGLRIDGRLALQQLIREVEAGRVDFQIILVYDVSRWGRFQDAGAYGRDHAGRAALAEESKPKKPPTGTADALARLQPEMEQVQQRYKLAEQTYGENVLNLVLARSCLQKLSANVHVHDFLRRHQPDDSGGIPDHRADRVAGVIAGP